MARIAFHAGDEIAVTGDALSLMQLLNRATGHEKIEDPASGRALPKGFAPVRIQEGDRLLYVNPAAVAFVTD